MSISQLIFSLHALALTISALLVFDSINLENYRFVIFSYRLITRSGNSAVHSILDKAYFINVSNKEINFRFCPTNHLDTDISQSLWSSSFLTQVTTNSLKSFFKLKVQGIMLQSSRLNYWTWKLIYRSHAHQVITID